MAKLTLIFTTGDGVLNQAISGITHGPYTHVAVKILDSVLESYGVRLETDPFPGVWLHRPDRYSDTNAVFVDVEVSNIVGAEQKARELMGTFYGYSDCIRAALFNLWRIIVRGNGDMTANCSETVLKVLRAGGFDPLPGIEADSVAPMDLYRVLG